VCVGCYFQLTLFLAHRFLSPWWWMRYVTPKLRFLQEPRDITSQKMVVHMRLEEDTAPLSAPVVTVSSCSCSARYQCLYQREMLTLVPQAWGPFDHFETTNRRTSGVCVLVNKLHVRVCVTRDVLEGCIIGPVTLSLVSSIISGRQIPHYFGS
jgi:hypothetical protein